MKSLHRVRKWVILGALVLLGWAGVPGQAEACHRQQVTVTYCCNPCPPPPCHQHCVVYYYNWWTCRYEVWGYYNNACDAWRTVQWLRCHGYCAYYCCYWCYYPCH